MRHGLILIALSLCLLPVHAWGQQTADSGRRLDDFERRLYDSYVAGKMGEWRDIIREMTSGYGRDKNPDLLHSLCFAQYGYIGYCLREGLEKEADESLQEAWENSRELSELFDQRGDVLALQGALLGYRIVLSKFRAVLLGPKAYRLIHASNESRDRFFNCSLEMGNMLFYTPRVMGGSKEKAVPHYVKAAEIVERSGMKEERSWLYMHTLVILANAHYETGSGDRACDIYARLLEYEPGAGWIRDELYLRCKKTEY